MEITVTKAAPDDLVKAAVEQAVLQEKQLAVQLEAIKTAQEKIDQTWAAVKDTMVQYGIKTISGELGPYKSITIAERTSFKTDLDRLDEKYKKLAPDTKKIGTYFALTGEAPEGAEPVVTQYLTKRAK